MGFDNRVPTGIATGVSGTLMGSEVITSIAAAARFIPAAGDYYMYAVGADVRVQVQDSTGTWQNVTAVAVGGFISCDGTNVGLRNSGAGAENVTLQKCG